jgi:hypothetical protein
MNRPTTIGSGVSAIDDLYVHSVKPLPVSERLQLAARILNDIPLQAVVDYQTEWTEQDLRDVTAYSLLRSAASFDEDDNA